MKTLLKTLLTTACVLASTQSNAQLFGKKEPPKPVVLEASTSRAEAFKQLIDDGAAFRHVPKIYSGSVKPIAIGNVTLEFVTNTEASSKVYQSASGVGTVQTAVNYKLLGVSPETMQSIADGFAQELRKAITAQGYTVLEQEQLLKDAAFAASVAEAAATEPQARTAFLTKNGYVKVTAKGTADTSGMSGAFKEIALSKAFDHAPVVKANLVLNFAQLQDVSSATTGHKVEVAHRVQLSISGGNFALMQETGSATFPFLRTVVLPSQIASKVTKLETTTGEKATTVFVMLLGGKIASTNNYEVTAVDNYAEVVSADLKVLAEVMAQGLKKQ